MYNVGLRQVASPTWDHSIPSENWLVGLDRKKKKKRGIDYIGFPCHNTISGLFSGASISFKIGMRMCQINAATYITWLQIIIEGPVPQDGYPTAGPYREALFCEALHGEGPHAGRQGPQPRGKTTLGGSGEG